MADFEGGAINNSFNLNPNYRIEPLHVCVLPAKGRTVVMLFKSEGAKRHRAFEKQFRALDEADKLQTVVKLVFAYSEDVLISPRIGGAVLKDENLVRLAQMNSAYQGFGDTFDAYKCASPRRLVGNMRLTISRTRQNCSRRSMRSAPLAPRGMHAL